MADVLTQPELILTEADMAINILAAHVRATRLRKVQNRRDGQRRKG